jgi:hypothetical protein
MAICTVMVRGRPTKSPFSQCWYLNSYRRMAKKSEYFNRVYSFEKGTLIVPSSQCRRDDSWIKGSSIPDRVLQASLDLSHEESFFANLR